jgi:hypothetical protein
VLGAFRATPVRQLETETFVSPLDLWLNGRVARFQARLERTGIARQIQDTCTAIRTHLQVCRRRRVLSPGLARKQWVEKWIGEPLEQWGEREKELVLKDWRTRWQKGPVRIERPGTDPGGQRIVVEDTAPDKRVLQLHAGLRKAESAILIQACTGKIGLAKFLYTRKVPGVVSAQCGCGRGEETARHMVLFCTKEAERHRHLRTNGRVDYRRLIGTNEGAKKLTEWMMRSGRLGQFSLAKRLLYDQ